VVRRGETWRPVLTRVRLVPGTEHRVPVNESSHLPGRSGYAVTFDLYFRCAAYFETPSMVPISDQLRWLGTPNAPPR
jgi:hypothetical protein